MSCAQQRSLGRVIAGKGYASVFSPPPPASNTFLVPPGGVAVLARDGLGLRRIKAVESLAEWEDEGRMVAAYLSYGNQVVVVVAVYGYPASHMRHDMNDTMLIQLHNWISSLKMPVLVAGDLNTTTSASSYLSICQRAGVWRISPDLPSTTNRFGGPAEGKPIDHVLVNSRLLDLGVVAAIQHDICMSDHFPVTGAWNFREGPDLPSLKWPSRMDVSGPIVEQVPWAHGSTTYTAWAEKATRWISDTYLVPQISKTALATIEKRATPRLSSQRFKDFRKLFGLLSRARRNEDESHDEVILGICQRLGIDGGGTLLELEEKTRDAYSEHLTQHQNGVLKAWKEKVKKWSVRTKHVFQYLRNLQPAKMLVLKTQQSGMTSDPVEMNHMLESVWRPVENWLEPEHEAGCLEQLEDKYSFHLPCVPFWFDVQPIHLYNAIRAMKPTAPGPDRWTRDELATLPMEALAEFLVLWKQGGDAMLTHTLLGQFRRVPLEKKKLEIPEPDTIRPIDVYSALLRSVSSAYVSCLRPWLSDIAHPAQYALSKGAQKAVSTMNRHAECVLSGVGEVWAVSIDMTKMFNMLSMTIALKAAHFMGLDQGCCEQLRKITACCKGAWRMPGNVAVPSFRRGKGLPQGMATSVAMAEVCVSVLLWRIQHAAAIQMVAYVDDLNFIASCREDLRRVLALVEEFTIDFHLVLSRQKTCLWGTCMTGLQEMGREWGLTVATCLECLGAEWGLLPSSKPGYAKEMARLKEASERMRRLAHLPLPLIEKAKVLASGCLSLLDYCPIPSYTLVSSLRSSVRAALGQKFGSPEVLFEVVAKTSVDPMARWLLSACRMFMDWWKEDRESLSRVVLSRRNSRIAALCRFAKTLKWTVDMRAMRFHNGYGVSWDRPWREFREAILMRYRQARLACVKDRRPEVYAGVEDIDVAQHNAMLRLLGPHSASLLVRVWCGCAMTGAHRARMDPTLSPACPCGAPVQDMTHLLYKCELLTPPSRSLLEWSRRDPACSAALLCPKHLMPSEKLVWREACGRAVRVLTQDLRVARELDWKGHVVAYDHQQRLAYCVRCFTSRKIRDCHFVASAPCPGDLLEEPCPEGSYVNVNGHILRCEMRAWKRASARPGLVCYLCGIWFWPRTLHRRPPHPCPRATHG